MSTGVRTGIGRFVWHDHVSSDPRRAQDFYTALLGWTIEVWKPGELDYPMIVAGGQMHGGFGSPESDAPAHWLGNVLVEDVDATAARAEAAGGSLLVGPIDIPEVGRMAVIRDPQGAVFAVFAPTGDPPTSEGTFLWDELVTSDVEAAKRFYAEVLAWTPSDMDMGEYVYTVFSSGEVMRAGALRTPPGVEAPPSWTTYLAAGDVDATAARATELGGQVYREPWDVPTVGRLAILADPTGAVFGLYKPSGP
jgi:predicted enzyme related to lactoylglutathione lyase